MLKQNNNMEIKLKNKNKSSEVLFIRAHLHGKPPLPPLKTTLKTESPTLELAAKEDNINELTGSSKGKICAKNLWQYYKNKTNLLINEMQGHRRQYVEEDDEPARLLSGKERGKKKEKAKKDKRDKSPGKEKGQKISTVLDKTIVKKIDEDLISLCNYVQVLKVKRPDKPLDLCHFVGMIWRINNIRCEFEGLSQPPAEVTHSDSDSGRTGCCGKKKKAKSEPTRSSSQECICTCETEEPQKSKNVRQKDSKSNLHDDGKKVKKDKQQRKGSKVSITDPDSDKESKKRKKIEKKASKTKQSDAKKSKSRTGCCSCGRKKKNPEPLLTPDCNSDGEYESCICMCNATDEVAYKTHDSRKDAFEQYCLQLENEQKNKKLDRKASKVSISEPESDYERKKLKKAEKKASKTSRHSDTKKSKSRTGCCSKKKKDDSDAECEPCICMGNAQEPESDYERKKSRKTEKKASKTSSAKKSKSRTGCCSKTKKVDSDDEFEPFTEQEPESDYENKKSRKTEKKASKTSNAKKSKSRIGCCSKKTKDDLDSEFESCNCIFSEPELPYGSHDSRNEEFEQLCLQLEDHKKHKKAERKASKVSISEPDSDYENKKSHKSAKKTKSKKAKKKASSKSSLSEQDSDFEDDQGKGSKKRKKAKKLDKKASKTSQSSGDGKSKKKKKVEQKPSKASYQSCNQSLREIYDYMSRRCDSQVSQVRSSHHDLHHRQDKEPPSNTFNKLTNTTGCSRLTRAYYDQMCKEIKNGVSSKGWAQKHSGPCALTPEEECYCIKELQHKLKTLSSFAKSSEDNTMLQRKRTKGELPEIEIASCTDATEMTDSRKSSMMSKGRDNKKGSKSSSHTKMQAKEKRSTNSSIEKMCTNCFGEKVPVIKSNLLKSIDRIVGKRKETVFLKFTLLEGDLVHIMISTSSERNLGCLYATEKAVLEAKNLSDFKKYVSICITSSSTFLQDVKHMVNFPFELVDR